jgi:hypothetical protein
MRLRLLIVVAALLIAPAAFGGTYSLNGWCFYVNSTDVNRSCSNGSSIDNFNPPATIGTWTYQHLASGDSYVDRVTVQLGAGSYNIFAIYNYDLDGGALNEYATVLGSIPVNQVFSAGGYGQTPNDLYSQYNAGGLNNLNASNDCGGACDLGVGLGYSNLVVPGGSTGTVTFLVTNGVPPSGGYIQQTDTNGGSSLNFSTDFTTEPLVSGGGAGAGGDIGGPGGGDPFGGAGLENPEPGTMVLMTGGVGLIVLALRRRKRA